MKKRSSARLLVISGLLLALALALLVSPWADSNPDGLDRVAQDEGFADSESDHRLGDSPLADYSMNGVNNERIAKGLSGVIGVLATFALGLALFALVRKRRAPDPEKGVRA